MRLPEGMGLVTDAELRELGLAAGRSPEDPVRTIAQTEPLSAPADYTVGEVLVERAGLVGANEKHVPLDDPVDSVVCVVFSRSGQILLSIPLAAPHAREVGQH